MVNSIAMGKQLYRELPPDRPRGYVSRKLLSWLIRAALVVAFFAVANVALVGILLPASGSFRFLNIFAKVG